MGIKLTIPAAIASRLANHLAAGPEEQLAFMLAEPAEGGFAVTDIRAVVGRELDDQSHWHLELRDTEGAAVIKWAHATGSVLVEAHVHLDGFAAAFSRYDVINLAEWVPHVWWRLGQRPYLALVFAGSTFDGLAWVTSSAEPEQIEALIVEGGAPLRATALTLSRELTPT